LLAIPAELASQFAGIEFAPLFAPFVHYGNGRGQLLFSFCPQLSVDCLSRQHLLLGIARILPK
jgi:hypothetical protein